MTTLLETSGHKSKLSSSDTMPRLVVNSKRTRVLAALICESSSGYLQPSLKFREASVNGLMLKSNFLSLAHFWAASVVRRRTRSGEASGGRCISLHRVPIAEIHGQSTYCAGSLCIQMHVKIPSFKSSARHDATTSPMIPMCSTCMT